MRTVVEIISLARDLGALAVEVLTALDSGDAERVEDILPAELRTTMARQIADARARLKYGSGR